MMKRVICWLCAVCLVMGIACRPVFAQSAETKPTAGSYLSGTKVSHRPAPLASAMLLVLAGMGFSMLFDKKDRED